MLAAAIRKIGPYDLILCGEGSSDMFNQQTAPRLAALLGLPCLSLRQKLSIEGDVVTATRKLERLHGEVSVKGPVVSQRPQRDQQAAHPQPQAGAWGGQEAEPGDQRLPTRACARRAEPKAVRKSVKGFVMQRKNIIYKETNAAANVAKLKASLASEGLCLRSDTMAGIFIFSEDGALAGQLLTPALELKEALGEPITALVATRREHGKTLAALGADKVLLLQAAANGAEGWLRNSPSFFLARATPDGAGRRHLRGKHLAATWPPR